MTMKALHEKNGPFAISRQNFHILQSHWLQFLPKYFKAYAVFTDFNYIHAPTVSFGPAGIGWVMDQSVLLSANTM